METPFSLLVFGLGLLLLFNQKNIGALLIGVSIYLRLELLIPVSFVFVLLLIKKQLSWRHIFWALIGVLPFILFDLIYFGTVIPQSIIAKPVVYNLKRSQTLLFILFASIPPVNFFESTIINAIVFISLIVLIFSVIFQLKKRDLDWPLFFFGWSISTIIFYLVTKAYVFPWYHALYTIPLVLSGFVLVKKTQVVVIRIHLVVVSLVLGLGLISTLVASLGKVQYYSNFVDGSRVKTYLNLGGVLYSNYPYSDLLTSEIGGLGYSFPGKIIDAAGLATDQAIDFHPMLVPQERSSEGIGAIPPAFVRQMMPDIIVSYDYFIEALRKDEVLEEYLEFHIPAFLPEDKKYSSDNLIWGSEYLCVFIRNDLPIPQGLIEINQ